MYNGILEGTGNLSFDFSDLMKTHSSVFLYLQPDLVEVTRDALGVPKLQVTVIHKTQDEAAITGRALCNLVLEWLKKQLAEEEIQLDLLKEKVQCF